MKSEPWERLVELRERFQEIDLQLDELTQDSQRLASDMTKEEEIRSLKTRAEFLDQNRADITRRLEELEKEE